MTMYIKYYGQSESGAHIYAAFAQSDLAFVTWSVREQQLTDPLPPSMAWAPADLQLPDPGEPPSGI